jgi:YD repeat-containing protein
MNVTDNRLTAQRDNSFRTVHTDLLMKILPLLLCIGLTGSLTAQHSSILPKNAKEIARERDRIIKEQRRITTSSIVSVTQKHFRYRFGKIENTGMTESVTRYDRSGNIVEEVLYNIIDGSVQQRKTYRYDSRKNLVEENLFKDDNIFKTVHRYNAADRKRETVYYKSDGSIEKKVSYILDAHGTVLETIGYLNDGRLFLRESFLYDRRGNITEFKNSLNTITYRYDDNNNVRTILKFTRLFAVADSARYVLSDRYEMTYDRFDNLLSMSHFAPDSALRIRIDYRYNADGNLTEEKEFNRDGAVVYLRKITYDTNGNPVEETGSDRSRKFRFTHTYDARGSKIEMTEFDQINEPKYTIKYSYGRLMVSKPQRAPDSGVVNDTLSAAVREQMSGEEFEELLGGRLVAPDGAFLGLIIADTSSSQSIVNSWGQYGFSDSPTSIFNPAIPYGGKEGVFSPFNPSSPSPPSIYKEGKFYAYFTENPNFRPRSSPKRLIAYLRFLAGSQ